MNKKLKEKILEALSSVLPITLIVAFLSITIAPLSVGTLVLFLVGAMLLIVGMGFFSLGSDMSMMPIGDGIGAQLTRSKNLLLIIGIGLLIGTVITIAEPDLKVLATRSGRPGHGADFNRRRRRRTLFSCCHAAHHLSDQAIAHAHRLLPSGFHLVHFRSQ